MTPAHALFYGGPLHGERHVVTTEVVKSVVSEEREGGGVTLREVAYRRVERNHSYGGAIYNPPGDLVPYVYEDWLPLQRQAS